MLESVGQSLRWVLAWAGMGTTSIASILMSAAMVLGLGGLARSFEHYRTSKRLQTDSLTSLLALPDDDPPHEVHGVAKPHGEPFTAPFTGTECVAYLYDVIADPEGDPQRIAFGGEMGPFRLETETGTAFVDLEEVTFEVERGDEYEVGPHGTVPSSIWRRVESVDDESKRPDLPDETPDGGMRLVERRVDPGSEVYAIGEAERTEDADANVASDADVLLADGEAVDSRISDAAGSELATRYRKSAIRSLLGGLLLLGSVAAVYVI